MTRLTSTLALDVKLQARSNLYYIAAGLAIIFTLLMRQFFSPEALETILPSFFLLGMGSTTYMFVAGMLLLEKDARTLDGIIVSPLRIREYMASKVITLTVVAAIESSIVLLLSYGTGFNWLLMFVGFAFMGVMLTLLGLGQVVRNDSITDFLLPAIVIVTVSQLPIFLAIGFGPAWLWYLIPTTSPYLLMLGAFEPLSAAQLAYALLYGGAWIVGSGVWARAAFIKHIVLMGGD